MKSNLSIQSRSYQDLLLLQIETTDFYLDVEIDSNDFMKASLFCHDISPEIQYKGILRDINEEDFKKLEKTHMVIDEDEFENLNFVIKGFINDTEISISFKMNLEQYYNLFVNDEFQEFINIKGVINFNNMTEDLL